jgi:hypothetical protein
MRILLHPTELRPISGSRWRGLNVRLCSFGPPSGESLIGGFVPRWSHCEELSFALLRIVCFGSKADVRLKAAAGRVLRGSAQREVELWAGRDLEGSA